MMSQGVPSCLSFSPCLRCCSGIRLGFEHDYETINLMFCIFLQIKKAVPQGKLPELGPAAIGKSPDKESQKARLTPMTRKCLCPQVTGRLKKT